MKKGLYLLITILFFNCNNELLEEPQDNSCDNGTFVGNVVLYNQEEVDEFAVQCYTKVEGSLLIGAPGAYFNDITDLTNLDHIVEVFPGRLNIEGVNLQSLSGLHNITKTGGLTISHTALTNFVGLDGLVSIGDLDNTAPGYSIERLEVNDNINLINFQGLNNLEAVEGILIVGNPELLSLQGLENLNTLISPMGSVSNPYSFAMQIGRPSCLDACFRNRMLGDICALQNLFINGFYDPDNVSITLYSIIDENSIDSTGFSVQDIIDGNCSL